MKKGKRCRRRRFTKDIAFGSLCFVMLVSIALMAASSGDAGVPGPPPIGPPGGGGGSVLSTARSVRLLPSPYYTNRLFNHSGMVVGVGDGYVEIADALHPKQGWNSILLGAPPVGTFENPQRILVGKYTTVSMFGLPTTLLSVRIGAWISVTGIYRSSESDDFDTNFRSTLPGGGPGWQQVVTGTVDITHVDPSPIAIHVAAMLVENERLCEFELPGCKK